MCRFSLQTRSFAFAILVAIGSGFQARAGELPGVTVPLSNESALSAAQRRYAQAQRLAEFQKQPREVQDQPYVPIDPTAVQTAPASTWTRGRFTSIQVNVNGAGNDILNDAANEPSIAVDPTNPDRLVAGWRQFDTIASNFRQAGYAYSHDRGLTWIFTGVLEPGVFRSDPIMETDNSGAFYYNSLTNTPGFISSIFKSINGGVTWTGPFFAFGGDKQWFTIDKTGGIGDGHQYQIWNPIFDCPTCAGGSFNRSINDGAAYQTPLIPPDDLRWGTVAVGPDGEMYIVGISNFTGDIVVMRSDDAKDSGVTPTFPVVSVVDLDGFLDVSAGPNPGGLLGQLWITVNHAAGPSHGDVYVCGSVSRSSVADPLDVMFTRSTDGGQTWSASVRINDDVILTNWQWFGTMDVAPNGRIDVVWNDTRANLLGANLSELYYAHSEDGGVTWSVNEPVSPVFNSHIGWPQQNKIGDYYDIVSDNAGANVIYSATFNGGQDVYYVRVGLDCNTNGVLDEIDIAAQTSPDANNNDVPDECEPNIPLPAPPPHDRRKNRYISFDPNNASPQIGFRVDKVSGTPGFCWVAAPDAAGNTKCTSSPVFRSWTEPMVHVGDCAIAPVQDYRIFAVRMETGPIPIGLDVSTIAQPTLNAKQWGDLVGFNNGVELTPPNQFTNVNDVQAVLAFIQNAAIKPTFQQANLQAVSSNDPCLNALVNTADVLIVVRAASGDAYPFTTNPVNCPSCP